MLDEFRRFLAELCDRAIAILSRDLIFLSSSKEINELPLDRLIDNMNESTVGYSFLAEPANKLDNRRKRILGRLLISPT